MITGCIEFNKIPIESLNALGSRNDRLLYQTHGRYNNYSVSRYVRDMAHSAHISDFQIKF